MGTRVCFIAEIRKIMYISYKHYFLILLVQVKTASSRRFQWVPKSMFYSRNKKNNVYFLYTLFSYIKVGFEGVNIM